MLRGQRQLWRTDTYRYYRNCCFQAHAGSCRSILSATCAAHLLCLQSPQCYSWFISDLTATPCPMPLRVSKSAVGLVCKEINGAGRPGNGFPTPNHCEQHKLQQNWIHLKKTIISSPHPLTEHVYISNQSAWWWIFIECQKTIMGITHTLIREISADCQQKIHHSNRISLALKTTHNLSLWMYLYDTSLRRTELGKLLERVVKSQTRCIIASAHGSTTSGALPSPAFVQSILRASARCRAGQTAFTKLTSQGHV